MAGTKGIVRAECIYMVYQWEGLSVRRVAIAGALKDAQRAAGRDARFTSTFARYAFAPKVAR